VLEYCREGENNCWFSIFPSDRDEPTYETGISLMQQLQFREIFEASAKKS
jgi:hypothetical protein